MTDCIETTRYKNKFGYGCERYEGKVNLSHRVAFAKHHNLPIEQLVGKIVRHTCDNPPCVNPDHLLLGTHQDNMDDMKSRGRENHPGIYGEINPAAKLSDQQVIEIRESYTGAIGEQRVLAKTYGVSTGLISMIINNKVRTVL